MQRGLHNIYDELVFEGNDGYVFHDSRGFECGSGDELKIVQEFVGRKSCETRLKDRLHAIWFVSFRDLQLRLCKIVFRFCVAMDNTRPSGDLGPLDKICPDNNGVSKFSYMNWDRHLTPGIFQVPIMVLFTKHDQFGRNIKLDLTNESGHPNDSSHPNDPSGITEADHFNGKMAEVFEKHYIAPLESLREGTAHICLKSE